MAIVGGTWTYSGDPSADDKDAVRFLCLDTNQNDQRLSDEEILYLLATQGGAYRAASQAADMIAGQFAAAATEKQVGDLRLRYDARAAEMRQLAGSLRARANAGAVPMFGGGSIQRKNDVEALVDRVPPRFERDLFSPLSLDHTNVSEDD